MKWVSLMVRTFVVLFLIDLYVASCVKMRRGVSVLLTIAFLPLIAVVFIILDRKLVAREMPRHLFVDANLPQWFLLRTVKLSQEFEAFQ